MPNTLYFGDNLHVLREHIASESVDLIYLDPPFNSNANYNILFRSPDGDNSESQIEAFEDTWHWNDSAEDAFDEVMRSGNTDAFTLLRAMREFLGDNDMMAYLAMMAVRLIELHRVLKPTGSLYLHCDPTASHYLKLLLDGVFGARAFRSEIVWKRSSAHNDAKQGLANYGHIHDVIFFYSKGSSWTWSHQFTPYEEEYTGRDYKLVDEETGRRFRRGDLTAAKGGGDTSYDWRVKKRSDQKERWVADLDEEHLHPREGWEYKATRPYSGRYWAYSQDNMRKFALEGRLRHTFDGMPEYKRFLDEMPGVSLQDLWADIRPLQAHERLGYPTEKPVPLLERIIAASSNEGDVVLDPFCGCGTAVHAAQKLGRQWVGIDVTHLAIGLIEKRMKDAFPGLAFEVKGRPQSLKAAEDLAKRDKHQFELWALSVVDADPWKGGRKGPDGGIDGIIWFKPDGKKTEKAIVEVKGGATGVKDVGRLAQVMEREGAKIGVLITAQLPTRAMERDAAAVGVWENEYTGRKHPRLQIITLAELFQNKRPDIPWVDTSSQKRAKREETGKQGKLL
ncbi:site-specific DNA-methyltransferase [Parerythrobacter lacustris]|uniref:site-specific DNA-methyltransferase (adenine-specific) n=1 Tax=Parerythrobacter lacustris TaxID=2969984 RepID=A0ABT1XTL8_9SPHN|nr:DNA methyltransferase [Parerythrobacter lacustris]MCR2834983.1 DNA methyltransferase [Parerythrobacter lacustris]